MDVSHSWADHWQETQTVARKDRKSKCCTMRDFGTDGCLFLLRSTILLCSSHVVPGRRGRVVAGLVSPPALLRCQLSSTQRAPAAGLYSPELVAPKCRSGLMSENRPSDRRWCTTLTERIVLIWVFFFSLSASSFHPRWTPAKCYPPITPNYISIYCTVRRVASSWLEWT